MRKNIALFISKLDGGGAERVVSNLSLNLSNQNDKKIIIYNKNQVGYPFEGELIDLDINPLNTPKVTPRNSLIKAFRLIKTTRKLRHLKKTNNIKTTVSFLNQPNILNLFSKSDDKIIISVRNYRSSLLQGFDGKLYTVLIKLFYNKADLIVAISKGVKKDLIQNFNIDSDNIVVIYNPLEINKIQKLMEEEIDEEYKHIFKHPVIINVARLVKQKGQNHLIKAFSKVKENVNDAKLVILGKGDLEKELLNLAIRYGLENDIYLIGFQTNPFKFINKSCVFVFPSLNEGFGNSLVEAMACGIPVISTDCKSGPREILAPNTDIDYETDTMEYAPYGILTPVCDRNSTSEMTEKENILAGAIIKLLKDHELNRKYGNLAQKRAEHFDVKNIIPQWEKIL